MLLGGLISSAQAKDGTAGGDWILRFQDDFQRAELGPDWQVLDGHWRIETGRLVGKGTLLCTRRFPGAHRIEYEARTDAEEPCDLSAVISAGDAGLAEGAFFGFGSDDNDRSKLALAKKEVARSTVRIAPGRLHRVTCERDGLVFRQTIDGKTSIEHVNGGQPVLREWREGGTLLRELTYLSGKDHERVGLYIHASGSFDNVRIYTKSDSAARIPAVQAEEIVGERLDATGNTVVFKKRSYGEGAGNLLTNPGFERPKKNTQTQPADWVEVRHGRGDAVEVVTDPQAAHWGRRYLRLHSPGDGPIQAQSVPEAGIKLEPGREYTVRVWARTDGGSATMTVEPGRGKVELTDEWTEYRFTHAHPKDAPLAMGFFVAILGGPAAVDDVSLVRSDRHWDVQVEWKADFDGIPLAKTDHGWLASSDGEPWAVRVPIVLTEVMGRSATDYLVALRLSQVYSAYGYEFLAPDRFAVVSGATGARVPSSVVNDDPYRHFTHRDFLMFHGSCRARARATYYVYFKDPHKLVGRPEALAKPPRAFTAPSAYPHRLYCDVRRPQRRVQATCDVRDGRLAIAAWDRAGGEVSATLFAPGGAKTKTIPLQIDADQPGKGAASVDLNGPLTREGIWELRVAGTARTAFVLGSVMWGAGNVRRVDPASPPVFGAGRGVQIAAAGNERESFQAVIDTTRDLGAIDLSVGDLVGPNGVRIPASNVKIDRLEDVLITSPPVGARAGSYADIVLPWWNVTLRAGERAVAWITVSVPGAAPAGLYKGEVAARTGVGRSLALPVELTVFDFRLPHRLAFTPALGADPWGAFYRHPDAVRMTNPTGADGAYYCFDRVAAREYAHHLARNHCTPWYYYQETSPYPSPWHYDPKTKTVSFDFSIFDREAQALLDAGAKWLSVGERFMSGWRRAGLIGDWKDDELRWGGWKGRPTTHRQPLDSPEGLDMLRAWGKGMGAHLKEKGWHDKAYVYIVDEAKNEMVRRVTAKVAEALAELPIPVKTWGLSYCHSWMPFHDHISAIGSSGFAEDKVVARLRERGAEYWGSYNRPHLVGYPLAVPRLIGPQSYFSGVDRYTLWSSWRTVGGWVNAHSYRTLGNPKCGYPPGTFIAREDWHYGLGTLNVPWPAGEPLPDGKRRAFAPTIRFEALRESVEDYEYLLALSRIAKADDTPARHARKLLARADRLIRQSARAGYIKDPRVTSHSIYDIDERAYQALRREMGLMIGRVSAIR